VVFFLDGHYHSLIVLTRWPRTTYPGIIQRLTNLRLLDYAITVNVDPLPISQKSQGGERTRPRGRRLCQREENLPADRDGEKAEEIHALMQGQTIPFTAMFAIRVWDKTRDGLNAKAGAIKNAINSMNAAQYFENTAQHLEELVLSDLAGWTWDATSIANFTRNTASLRMLPVTSTFTGHLAARRRFTTARTTTSSASNFLRFG